MNNDLKFNLNSGAVISASILAADLANLAADSKKILEAGVDAIHFDVMDHHFVPNLTFGAPVCSALRKAGINGLIDAHLMVATPEDFVSAFAKAGANLLTFHPKNETQAKTMVNRIKSAGMQAGIAFSPNEPVCVTEALLKAVDLVLIMCVNPGFHGQAFMPDRIDAIREMRALLDAANSHAFLGVDGGIQEKNIDSVHQAGADFFVMGSGLFKASNYTNQVQSIRKILA